MGILRISNFFKHGLNGFLNKYISRKQGLSVNGENFLPLNIPSFNTFGLTLRLILSKIRKVIEKETAIPCGSK